MVPAFAGTTDLIAGCARSAWASIRFNAGVGDFYLAARSRPQVLLHQATQGLFLRSGTSIVLRSAHFEVRFCYKYFKE